MRTATAAAPTCSETGLAGRSRLRRSFDRALQSIASPGAVAIAGFSVLYGVDRGVGGILSSLTLFMSAYAFAASIAPFAPRNIVPRTLVLALAVAAGVIMAYAVIAIANDQAVSWRGGGMRHTTSILPVLLTAFLGLAIFLLHQHERGVSQALADEVERKLDVERRVSEARLQVLKSQIEPHFLFNSLAHVRRLCRTNAPAGRAMLRNLAHYIGDAHAVLERDDISLASDVDLAVAYLNVQQIRMGERLRFVVDVPPEAQQARVPPMTLTTLVENAIKHGLSRLEGGGQISIIARVDLDAVVIEVTDTGRGFQSTVGGGVGLANIRARLAMLHGAAASLALSMNAPRGVVATIELPREQHASCPS